MASAAHTAVPPIPAFYACYLLRSSKRHASQYVGSTPNPRRRLRQHNGQTKGGAARTSKANLRPWEMVTLVTGFPSSVAALQFEWAWQNTHLTRHITSASRLTQAQSNVRISSKIGRTKKRPARPRMSLADRLANLHLLLTSTSFRRWPLKVIFFAPDVHNVWTKWMGAAQTSRPLRQEVMLHQARPPQPDPPTEPTTIDPPISANELAISSLPVDYQPLKPHLTKTRALLEDATWLQCSVCNAGLPSTGHNTLICPHDSCQSMGHLHCLSHAFLSAEDRPDREDLIPASGKCPDCRRPVQWVDLVKELSLRIRGEKEIEAVLKEKKRGPAGKGREVDLDVESEDDEEAVSENEEGVITDSEGSDAEVIEILDDDDDIPPKSFAGKLAAASKHTTDHDEESDWEVLLS